MIVGTKYDLKLTILIFWTKIGQKGCFKFKREKVNIITEFCVFELVTQVQEMPLRTPPETVVYQGRVDTKLTGIQFNATLLKKKLRHRCFPVNLAKFLRTPYSQSTSGQLLLILFEACFSYFPLSKILTAKKAASCEKSRLVENRLKMLSLKSFGDL